MKANIVLPTIEIELKTVKLPVFGIDGNPTGEYETKTVLQAKWDALVGGAGFDFMYRTVGDTGFWIKPSFTYTTRTPPVTGKLVKAIFLDDDGQSGATYEFLPITTTNPQAR